MIFWLDPSLWRLRFDIFLWIFGRNKQQISLLLIFFWLRGKSIIFIIIFILINKFVHLFTLKNTICSFCFKNVLEFAFAVEVFICIGRWQRLICLLDSFLDMASSSLSWCPYFNFVFVWIKIIALILSIILIWFLELTSLFCWICRRISSLIKNHTWWLLVRSPHRFLWLIIRFCWVGDRIGWRIHLWNVLICWTCFLV